MGPALPLAAVTNECLGAAHQVTDEFARRWLREPFDHPGRLLVIASRLDDAAVYCERERLIETFTADLRDQVSEILELRLRDRLPLRGGLPLAPCSSLGWRSLPG